MKTIQYIGTLGGVTIPTSGGREILALRNQPVSVPEEIANELLQRESDWVEAT